MAHTIATLLGLYLGKWAVIRVFYYLIIMFLNNMYSQIYNLNTTEK